MVRAALICEEAGADAITLHLREDRRHIQDADVEILRGMLQTRMNLECAVTDEMIENALRIKPHDICLVPERREELTTEGGLDVVRYFDAVRGATERCTQAGIRVSLFIDPDEKQLDAAVKLGAPVVEIHTGKYADANSIPDREYELGRIQRAVAHGHRLGLQVNAGHGLNYHNVRPHRCHSPYQRTQHRPRHYRRVNIHRAGASGEKNEGTARRMIFGIGTDIVLFQRIRQLHEKYGERFARAC